MKRRERDIIATFAVDTIRGDHVDVPAPGARLTHLQFRRFAGCPICNLHLREITRRLDEIVSAGIREIAVFHSERATMRTYQGDLPFDVVADPEKRLYRDFGVEASLRSVVDPRAWGGFLRGTLALHASSTVTGEGGHLGLPADFLIAPDGRIVAVKYGAHADDQWSVDELLELARRSTA